MIERIQKEGNYNVSRPINSKLMISIESFDKAKKDFDYAMQHIRELKEEVDLSPNMLTDDILSSQIRSLDFLLVKDIWRFVEI